MNKRKYILITVIAIILLLLGILYLVKYNTNSLKDNEVNIQEIDIYDIENLTSENSSNNKVTILLEDNDINITGSGTSVSGNVVTIQKAGIYKINGTLSDGQIVVDATKNDEVTIVLDNVNITCSSSSVIY